MRYESTPIDKSNDGKRFYRSTLYPQINAKISDIYVITVSGDRLDLLANQYYHDPTLWWIISSANGILHRDSLMVDPGTQLRIPGDIVSYLDEFNILNANR